MIRLRVWANVRPMGWFGHAAGEFFFEYDPEWLGQPDAFALAPHFALGSGPFTGARVRSFFENLLPEGTALDDVMQALALRDAAPFELLGRLGRELPGVISLLPEGAQPTAMQQYAPLSFNMLSARLQSQHAFDPLATQSRMLRTNPQVVLRNHLGEIAIQRAREGDFSRLQRLQAALEQPFDALPGCDDLADFPPEWAAQIEISCSS